MIAFEKEINNVRYIIYHSSVSLGWTRRAKANILSVMPERSLAFLNNVRIYDINCLRNVVQCLAEKRICLRLME